MTAPAACCPSPPHPPRITIAPGMAVLDRQIAGFGEWRQALVQSIGTPGWSAGDWAPGTWPLAGWTADRPDDLGVMLLEFWAYVLDICAFYDARIAERAYLGTAGDASTLGEIVALIGYEPRPALAGPRFARPRSGPSRRRRSNWFRPPRSGRSAIAGNWRHSAPICLTACCACALARPPSAAQLSHC